MKLVQKNGPSLKYFFVLVISIALGVLGVYLRKRIIDHEITSFKASMEKTEVMSSVVVPSRNLMKGEIVSASDLAVRELPAEYVDSNSVSPNNYKTALGQKVTFNVDQGKPLLWAHLDGGSAKTFSGRIDDGKRAMTMRVDEINSISGFLRPKDNVDLLLTYSDSDGTKTYPFMQNLHVLATGSQTVVDSTNPESVSRFSTITVHVNPVDAKRITLAQERGKLTAVLRNPEDEIEMSSKPLDFSELLPVKEEVVVDQGPGIEFIVGGV